MDFETFLEIDKIVKHYAGTYEARDGTLVCYIDDEEKEFLLNDLDLKGIHFSHEYEEDRLEITFELKKYDRIIKRIDMCIGDYSNIDLLCRCYNKFVSANKADKEFKYKTVNEFGQIAVICNLGLENFRVYTDVEFCDKLKEDLDSYCECGGDLDLLIDSFNDLIEK